MRTVETFPRAVREIENVFIPLPDGACLAARLWLPEDAESAPVPAIFEFIPYRKRDFTRRRDEPIHRYFAGHGYAVVRADLRGAGDSDGVLTDEYTREEHDDGCAAIQWIAAQAWCTGAVGMMGISWGGFNALQIAAHRPPALKAVLSLCASDDRYADDAHYMGGCLLNENLLWGSVLMHFNAYPPDPEIVGPRWRRLWHERLEAATLFPARWLAHQRRDDYWRHGSVCEEYGAIICPVYAMGGWADGYSNAVPRLLAGLRGPRKGLVGPWAHDFPHRAAPGPPIGFLQEALRWWDHWLKDTDTGVMREPMYRVWMQASTAPGSINRERPGRWIAESTWPAPHIVSRGFAINAGTLDATPADGIALSACSPQTTGVDAGEWCAFGADGDLPTDQGRDDDVSLRFDSAPLPQALEMFGGPEVTLELAIDRPLGFVAVRLNDVAPDGASLRVTYGLLNLAHRHGHDRPEPLEPGRRYRVHLRLGDIAHVFPAGHALRLAVSTSYWPLVWPSPEPVTLTIFPGCGWLALPIRAPAAADAALAPFLAPEQAPEMPHVTLRPGKFHRAVEHDPTRGETIHTVVSDDAEFEGAALARIPAIDLDLAASLRRRYRILDHDPLSASAEVSQRTTFRRGAWSVETETSVTLRATATHFRVTATLTAYEGGERVFLREWNETVPRDHL